MPALDHEMVTILVAVAVTAATLLILVLAVRSQRRKMAALEPLFEPGSARLSRLGGRITGGLGGYACRYAVQQRSQYNPGGAVLRIGVNAPVAWAARPQGLLSRGMVRLGLAQDLEIGDPDLDERLRFTARSTSDLAGALGTNSARAALARVSESARFQYVKVGSDRCELRWSPADRRADTSSEVVQERLESALELVRALGYPPRMG